MIYILGIDCKYLGTITSHTKKIKILPLSIDLVQPSLGVKVSDGSCFFFSVRKAMSYITLSNNPDWYLSCEESGTLILRNGSNINIDGVWIEEKMTSHLPKLLRHQTRAALVWFESRCGDLYLRPLAGDTLALSPSGPSQPFTCTWKPIAPQQNHKWLIHPKMETPG